MNGRSAVLLCMVFFLLTAPLLASNMGVALRIQLDPYPQALHFISLPYLYTPATADALCWDLGGTEDVSDILRWDDATSSFVEYSCGSHVGDFSLEEASGYGVRVNSWEYIDTLLVGIHDDSFEFNFAPGSLSNLHWVSLPYHLALPDAGGQADVVDAEDLCLEAGPELYSVLRWNEAVERFEAYVCGSEFGTPFELEQGVGYGLVNVDGETIQWQPTHY